MAEAACAGGDRWWSTLLPELLVLILQRLPSVRDRIRFSCVCSRWRSVLTEARHLLPPTTPLLLLPYAEDDNHSCPSRQVLHSGIPVNWVHRVLLPAKKVICGSSMGWLLVRDCGGDVHLWNPITKEEIPLPPPPCNFDCEYKSSCLAKVVLSSNPSSSSSQLLQDQDCCTVMTICKCLRALSFCRIRDDDTWTTFEEGAYFTGFSDVICYRGQFYAVTWGAWVVTLDVGGSNPKRITVAGTADRVGPYAAVMDYLVESSFGELLRVARLMNIDGLTIKFVVHKLDFDTKTWSKVTSLQGDQALFLGSSSSLSAVVAATDHRYKRNSIYFLDDSCCYYASDVGVFDLEDGSITKFGFDTYTCSSSNEDCPTPFLHSPQFWIDFAPW